MSSFLIIKKRTAEIISTILVLDINSLQIFFEINEKGEFVRLKNHTSSPKKSII